MRRDLVLIGAPTSAGSYAPGQEAAPRVLRDLGLVDALEHAGRRVRDAGDGPLQVWAPDRDQPRAQNLRATIDAVHAVADQAAKAFESDADVLVIGGNCTVALGVMSALTALSADAGLLYIDRHFDLNTPESTADGALDWMGIAHALDLPGAAAELSSAFGRRPLLHPRQLEFLGVDAQAATAWELEQVVRLDLRWTSSADFATDPQGSVRRAVEHLPNGPLAVHVDVDVLDFIDAPLAENTDGRNNGPTLDALAAALDIACHDSRTRALSIGELNPERAAGEPQILNRFIEAIAHAVRESD